MNFKLNYASNTTVTEDKSPSHRVTSICLHSGGSNYRDGSSTCTSLQMRSVAESILGPIFCCPRLLVQCRWWTATVTAESRSAEWVFAGKLDRATRGDSQRV